MSVFSCIYGGWLEVALSLLLANAIGRVAARLVNKWRGHHGR